MTDKLKVVLFSGGRGTANITEALLKHSQISLTLLVNAYDDGLSTGMLRRFIPGMLGPSDIRKNISRLIPATERSLSSLKKLLEYRLPDPLSMDAGLALMKQLADGEPPNGLGAMGLEFLNLNFRQILRLKSYCLSFLNYVSSIEAPKGVLAFSDCSLGNLFFAGCYLECGRDFNTAVSEFSLFCEAAGRVLNVTHGENLFLLGLKEDGRILNSEAAIVAPQDVSTLSEVFLSDRCLLESEIASLEGAGVPKIRDFLESRVKAPELNPAAAAVLAEADIIIYGPGTQHSSLFPSYLTRGLSQAIASNKAAEKIYISNILKDHEIQGESANSLVDKLLHYLNVRQASAFPETELVTTFFFQVQPEAEPRSESYLRFDPEQFRFARDRVVLCNFEAESGAHSGGRVLEELINVVNLKLQKKLRPFPYLVSIIVPGLNEERTVRSVLQELSLFDLQPYGLGKEVIFVDGGSTDRTLELATSLRDITVYSPKNCKGRGMALRHGVEKSSGNIIVFFPCDAEYQAKDVLAMVLPIIRGEFEVVFGSRSIRLRSIDERLREIYKGQGLIYFLSKYGGMTISILCLLFYNRYVSDALTGVKGFESKLIRGLKLKSDGLDLDTEIVAKLGLQGTYILELPVEYFPRTRAQGKKTTVFDGIQAIWALFRFRFF